MAESSFKLEHPLGCFPVFLFVVVFFLHFVFSDFCIFIPALSSIYGLFFLKTRISMKLKDFQSLSTSSHRFRFVLNNRALYLLKVEHRIGLEWLLIDAFLIRVSNCLLIFGPSHDSHSKSFDLGLIDFISILGLISIPMIVSVQNLDVLKR